MSTMGTCGATCGITKERERDKEAALAAARRAYPDLVWGDRRTGSDLALCPDAIGELGIAVERLLPVRAIPRLADGSGCDWLYLLAGLHRPSLVEIFDGLEERALPVQERETYVRVGFSPLGPYVTLQEVVMTASRRADGALSLVEEPVLGVEDRRLQAIVKGLQGALRKAKLVVLDMAFLVQVVSGPDQPEFARMYGGPPTRWSFLFEPIGPMTPRAVCLESSEARP
jgi:hypothetical protein